MSLRISEYTSSIGRKVGLDVARIFEQEFLYRLLFILAAYVLWEAVVRFISPGLVPTPAAVVTEMYVILATGEFAYHMANTLRRVLVAFVFAWIASVAIGIAMGMSTKLEQFFEMGVIVGLTIPGLAWAVICVMIFGLEPIAAYTAVFVVILPMITINFWQGVKDIDVELIEMGDMFEFGTYRKLRWVILPQLYPYMFSAGRFGLAVAWKVVVIVEFVGFGNGIGFMFGTEFQHFRMAAVLAWVGLFAGLMLIIEYVGFKYLERKYLAWRPEVGMGGQGHQ